MANRINHTVTIHHEAPLKAAVAEQRGVLKPVDRHKKAERRRIRRQENRAWVNQMRDELADLNVRVA